MADKSVGELVAATGVTPTDLFVLEQSGTAKKLTGQILENWLVSFADGHGGIQSITKLSTSGLVDTYRITLADTTTFDFAVTNGKGITSISKTSTSGLADTYTISYNDGTSGTLTVTNGEKGDKGDNAYIWIKYASQEPTESSNSMGDIPDDWIGIYSGNASTAPTDWQQYKWFQIKGEKGDTGSPATLVTKSVAYQVSDSGTIIPSGAWGSSIPVVPQGKYLWTKTELQFNTGDPIISYSVARMGIDGSGSVSSVAGVSPDETGNVALTASDVGALAVSGGDMTGAINMNGQPLRGLNAPTDDTEAAPKSYVDKMLPKSGGAMTGPIAMGGNKITDLGNPEDDADAASKGYVDKRVPLDGSKQMTGDLQMGGNRITDLGTPTANTDAASKGYVDTSVAKAAPRNLLDNSDFRNPVNQRGITVCNIGDYGLDRWIHIDESFSGTISITTDANGTTFSSYDGTSIGLLQRFIDENYYDGKYTAAIKTGDGSIFIGTVQTENAETHMQRVAFWAPSGTTVVWAALYEGSYTAETLPEYQPKGYAVELAECQRYFRWLKIGGAVNGNYIGYRIPLSPAMRTNPSTTGININTTSGPATITAGGYSAESDCFRVDAYIGSDADTWWAWDVALSADL